MNHQTETPSTLPPGRPLTPEAVESLHLATLDLLWTTGIWCGSKSLLDLAADHGLPVDQGRILFSPDRVEEALRTTGRQVTLLARNPEKTVTLARGRSLVGLGRSAPFIALAGGRRRNATSADFIEFTRLGQALDLIQMPGPLAFPGDLPPERVHRFMMAAQVRCTDKPFCLVHESDIDTLLMAFDLDLATLMAGPDSGRAWGQTTVNTQSPLALSRDQGDFLLFMARHGIPIAVSPCPAAGSSGPCSLAGNLILNNAEVLGTLVLIQLARPGLAVLYGTFPCGSDMRSMVATYAGPESRKMEAASALLADRYGLLTRGNLCLSDAQDIDFQAGAESMFNLISALRSGITYLPGCGIAGGFATASREKLILDAELVAQARSFLEPVGTDALAEVTDLIKKVGPRGSYITDPHTFAWFKKELYHPTVFARISNERWVKKDESLFQRASARADQVLATWVQPALDPVLDRHLERLMG
jgi:trimethylamine--corrinoid protein Co-methyltransferase